MTEPIDRERYLNDEAYYYRILYENVCESKGDIIKGFNEQQATIQTQKALLKDAFQMIDFLSTKEVRGRKAYQDLISRYKEGEAE